MNSPLEFSPREQQVIELLLQGKSNKQITLALHVAHRNVEFHCNCLFSITSENQTWKRLINLLLR
ncbi:MAG: hypothetical protein CVU43_07305 [Chloroflexi bacterium HGW-Chloroflexi-5]|jgi:DNA-binding NarL/FixJ family response regulator|nr:MAG: hypothetical protein CVU43_07305 [Chloroflexi bacterium HGW-Chloroflexi-5]